MAEQTYVLTKNGRPVQGYSAIEIDTKIKESSSSGSSITFEILADTKGNSVKTTFPSSTSILETITKSGATVATRATTFNTNNTITEVFNYYEGGTLKLTTTTTSTFNADGSITENVV